MDLSDEEPKSALLAKHADLKQEAHDKKKKDKKDKKHKKDKKKNRDLSENLKSMSEEQINALIREAEQTVNQEVPEE